jgi:hypothetical protein
MARALIEKKTDSKLKIQSINGALSKVTVGECKKV